MIYDVRMGPIAVAHEDKIYVAYQANPAGGKALPHVIVYDQRARQWSPPVVVGDVSRYDHHYGPILWLDSHKRIHVLFHCHGRPHESKHVVSKRPRSTDEWEEGPEIATHMTYPRLVKFGEDRALLYYRVFGHMGYWTYQTSQDGGATWSAPAGPIEDFDQAPTIGSDVWAGAYHSIQPGRDGRTLHIGFVYWDESRARNPLYGGMRGSICRYHLYYLRLDTLTGKLTNADGQEMTPPVNREQAERCKAWDTGHRLTNMPSIHIERDESPAMILPVSEESPWRCRFHCVRRQNGQWERAPVVETNHTWAGSCVTRDPQGTLRAFLVVGAVDGETLSYGGGEIEEWRMNGEGPDWAFVRRIVPEPDCLYNNPRFVETTEGGILPNDLIFYGWPGQASIQRTDVVVEPGGFTGKAFLWRNEQFL
ncbi:MAG: BNR-4 repeat-containing protein [Candidatus Sumerlaeota bacterium]|nr:BNR-4 repeat-containing protein [Candidatus Sumerlaeota bacterium]